MKWALCLLLSIPLYASSISLNTSGQYSTTWDGQPNTSIGGATNLFGSASGFNFDIYANDNHREQSQFKGGTFWFQNGSWGLYAGLSNISISGGVLTANFRSMVQEALPGGKGLGYISGTFQEQLLNGTFSNPSVSNLTSTVPESGTWVLMLIGISLLLGKDFYTRQYRARVLTKPAIR